MTETTHATAKLVAKPIEDIEEALRDVIDPELGVNIVDLDIDITLTSAACPLTPVIEDQVENALQSLVEAYRLNWVWMPPWSPEHITEDGRDQMRALGFNL